MLKGKIFPQYRGYRLSHIFTCVFLAVMLCLTLESFIFPNNDFIKYNPVFVILSAVAVGFLYSRLYVLSEKIKIKNELVFFLIFFAVIISLQTFIFYNTYYQPGWDVSWLTESGYWLAMNMGLPTDLHEYFACYPNNVTLLMIWAYLDKIAIRLFGYYDYLFVNLMTSCVMVDLSAFLIYATAKKAFSQSKAIFSLFITVPFLMLAPWLLTPYSDTMSMFAPVLAIYLFLQAKKSGGIKTYILLFLMGACTSMGMFIKPTAVIVLIAMAIAMVCTRKINIRNIRLYAVVLLGFIAIYLPADMFRTRVIVNSGISVEHIEQVKYPATHFLMMGMQKQVSMFDDDMYQYGKWAANDVNITYAQSGQKAKIQANLKEIKNRLSDFGFFGYLKFLNDKARWMLGDGTMYFGGEVLLDAHGFQTKPVSIALQKIVLYNGEYYKYVAYLLEGIWACIMGLCAIPLFYKSDKYSDEFVFILRLTVCGIILFLLLFEGRSRYLTNHLPVFILLALYALPDLPYNKLR